MVSVQDIEIDAINPSLESVPYSLKISRSNPVAAEEENIFTRVRGTNSPGKPIYSVIFPIRRAKNSRNPDARRMPTATISPISVGMILIHGQETAPCTFDKIVIDIGSHQDSVYDDRKNEERHDKIRKI